MKATRSKALAPRAHRRTHRIRALASIVAATCGGMAAVVAFEIVVGGVAPVAAPLLWLAFGGLVVAALTGLYWRMDSPDVRTSQHERERRGF